MELIYLVLGSVFLVIVVGAALGLALNKQEVEINAHIRELYFMLNKNAENDLKSFDIAMRAIEEETAERKAAIKKLQEKLAKL